MSEALKLEEEQTQEEEELQDVAVLDDASAEILLAQIREANKQYEKMESWYKFQLEKAKAVRDRTVEWAERSLRAYFDMVPTKRAKTQRSYELPSGKLILKEQQPKYDVKDDELVPWLEKNGWSESVKIKKEAAWADIKKALTITPDGKGMMTEDGEIVPGVTVELRAPKFSVTVK